MKKNSKKYDPYGVLPYNPWYKRLGQETHWFIEKWIIIPYVVIITLPASIYYIIIEGRR